MAERWISKAGRMSAPACASSCPSGKPPGWPHDDARERTQSIGTLLTAVTVVLAVLLVSIFAFWAKDASDRHRQAAHIRGVVTLKRAILAPRDDLRTELGLERAIFRRAAGGGRSADAEVRQLAGQGRKHRWHRLSSCSTPIPPARRAAG